MKLKLCVISVELFCYFVQCFHSFFTSALAVVFQNALDLNDLKFDAIKPMLLQMMVSVYGIGAHRFISHLIMCSFCGVLFYIVNHELLASTVYCQQKQTKVRVSVRETGIQMS